jgi:hypothetical protein
MTVPPSQWERVDPGIRSGGHEGGVLDITTDGGVVIDVHVQPGGSRDEVVGRHGDALKVKVSAPPEGGKANAAVCRLLADAFGVPVSAVAVTSGAKSRRKRVRVDELDAAVAASRPERLLD